MLVVYYQFNVKILYGTVIVPRLRDVKNETFSSLVRSGMQSRPSGDWVATPVFSFQFLGSEKLQFLVSGF